MMARGPATFKQADLTRAVKAARAAGLDVARTEIMPDGMIRLIHSAEVTSESKDEFEEYWSRRQGSRDAH